MKLAPRFALLFFLAAFSPIAPGQDATPPSSKEIAAALQPFVDAHTLAGAVTLVADKNEIISLDSVGFLDVAARIPMRPDALFWIASQSKPITAAAFMMLVDEGKISIDDPVSKYLPEFRDQWVAVEKDQDHVLLKKPTTPVTIRHILSHTSGLPFSSAMEKPTLDGLSLKDGVRSYAMTPLQWEPGSKYQYSNAGINTAGRIIEVVSGMPYEQFLQTRLFEPLGMKDTTFWPNPEQISRLAKAYKPDREKTDLEATTVGQLRYPLDDRSRHPMPAGGLFSTATDIARFCQMVLNGGSYHGKKLLSESSVTAMTSKQTGDALKEGYGLGWATGGGHFGHGGAFATGMNIEPKTGLITVFLVQHAGFPGDGNKSQGAFQKAAAERFAK